MRHLENSRTTHAGHLRLSSGKTIAFLAHVSGHVYAQRGQGFCDVTNITIQDLWAHDDENYELPLEPEDRTIIEDYAGRKAEEWLTK